MADTRTMFDNIVIGIDGRSGGEDATALGCTLAGPAGRIVLVRAFSPEGTRYDLIARREAEAELAAILPDRPNVERIAIGDTSPARALHAIASEHAAQAIVIGSCHRGPAGRVLLGDVSRSTLHGASCPVAVAPAGYASHAFPIRVVGAGFDGSETSVAALELADRIAVAEHAGLRVVSAVTAQPVAVAAMGYPVAYDVTDMRADALAGADAELHAAIDGLASNPAAEVREGRPVELLERLSEHVDLLVVGSRNYGTLSRVVLGSTSDRLAHRAACPLMVVPGT